MKKHALEAPANPNGLSILMALNDSGNLHVGNTNAKALRQRRARNRVARKSRAVNR